MTAARRHFHRARLAAAALVALAAARSADAVVSNDLHWVRERSPIRLYSPLVIDPLGSLTIDAGVEVQLMPDASLVVQGRLTALGTPSAPVRFVPARAGERWCGVRVESGDVVLQGVEVRGARIGVDAAGGATILAGSLVDGSEDAAVRVRAGPSVTVAHARLRHGVLGIEVEDGGRLTLRASEIAHASGTGLLAQPGARVLAESTAVHDCGAGIDVADAATIDVGRPGADARRGGDCLFSCNAVDVVNRGTEELPARGNAWTSASRIEGPVDASEPAASIAGALAAFDRLFVGKSGDDASFGWESLADCAEHVVHASSSPGASFDEASAPSATGALVFYRMVTRLD